MIDDGQLVRLLVVRVGGFASGRRGRRFVRNGREHKEREEQEAPVDARWPALGPHCASAWPLIPFAGGEREKRAKSKSIDQIASPTPVGR